MGASSAHGQSYRPRKNRRVGEKRNSVLAIIETKLMVLTCILRERSCYSTRLSLVLILAKASPVVQNRNRRVGEGKNRFLAI